MKRYTALFTVLVLTLGSQASSRGAEHMKTLDQIIQGFATKDTALQYEARRELATYAAASTAPDQVDGAEKLTKDLLRYLADRKVDHEAKKYILRDLARVGTGSAVAPLAKIMRGNDALLSESARQALEQIDDKQATAVFVKAIADARDDASRQTYIRSLANRRDPDSFGYFSKGLNSKDSLLAFESIYALTKMGDSKSTQALEKAYNASPVPELKLELERSVVSLDGSTDETLLTVAKSGINSANRQAALVRLVGARHVQADALMRTALAGSDVRLRATAIRLALANGKESLVKNNTASFSSNDWLILLGGLNAFDEATAESVAHTAVKSSDAGVQVEALRAMGSFGSGKSINVVLEHFAGRDRELQRAASYAIERMPGNTLNGRLNKMLNSDSKADVTLAIEALAFRDMPNAKGRLFKFVNGDDASLAREALKTLSTIADEEDLYKLLFIARRDKGDLGKMCAGLLKKVAPEIGSLELQAKVKAL